MTRGPYRTKSIPGSFADLIGIFRTQSPRYRGWSRATRKHADRVLDDFRMENGKRQASDLRFEDIVRMRDSMADMPGAANNWLKVISALMRYAKRIGYIDADPMATKLESLPPRRPGAQRSGHWSPTSHATPISPACSMSSIRSSVPCRFSSITPALPHHVATSSKAPPTTGIAPLRPACAHRCC